METVSLLLTRAGGAGSLLVLALQGCVLRAEDCVWGDGK